VGVRGVAVGRGWLEASAVVVGWGEPEMLRWRAPSPATAFFFWKKKRKGVVGRQAIWVAISYRKKAHGPLSSLGRIV